jgi:hypothetical protein
MRTDEHGGDLPTTRMENGGTVTAYPGRACPHCPAAFYKPESQQSHIIEKHPGQPYNHSVEDDKHRIDYFHWFTPQHPHFFVLSDKKSGQYLSNMTLDREGKVSGVETHPKHQRQGLATKLWDYAKSQSAMGIPEPKHSGTRTKEGEAWAKKIGGELPPRGRLLSARQMQGMIDFGRD